MTNDERLNGLSIKLKTLTWGSVASLVMCIIFAATWYQKVETALQEKTDDRYRARDAKADFAIRDVRLDAIERQISESYARLKEISADLKELRSDIQRMVLAFPHQKENKCQK